MAKFKFFLALLICGLNASAQGLSIKIIDSKDQLPLPYASIKLSNEIDLISNEEGLFNLPEEQNIDENILIIRYLGYQSQKISIKEVKQQNLVIKLAEAIFNLNEVSVNNIKPNPDELMMEVKKRLKTNYTAIDNPTKSQFFLRDAGVFKPSQMLIDINESTGFTKKQLKEVDKDVSTLCNKLKSNFPKVYEDILFDYYSGKNATKQTSKINVNKATIITGEGSTGSIDELQQKGLSLLFKHLDSTKYYRVKSGLFGSKDTISLKKTKKKEKDKDSNLTRTRNKLTKFLASQRFTEKSKFNFIYDPEAYYYKYAGKIYNDENDDVIHILKFSPRKSRAKYNGKLYISETDYAVVKCNYALAEGETGKSLNLKLLLGIKFKENIDNGTLLFKKSTKDNTYDLQYALEENGTYFYLNRPIKFIEIIKKSKVEKDVLAFDLKMEGNTLSKTELLSISKSEISQNTLENFKEKEFNYIKLKQYDPKIWSNQISIEPLETMKKYKAD
ncbi:carboxypeptidase-like regulatory domain-containing protein [Flavobacterium amnicola]|uniref:Carboxypeptidase-like regulatory domain-containing protein n=1 Tax=Flavobacterium amnicola TaxID=2506422 RepID=A0A4Q1K0F6_9FLAO|nr:carboxypeptidase-like regulatory domain-containing protein [Flavobacterium amnicola]RXR17365.1 carboxypeptidase-like regulatory domain-containing protein [Flavobacterium amnicola]